MLTYKDVPKDILENILWRQHWIREIANDRALEKEWEDACRRDILLFVNTWIWLYHPFISNQPDQPWITFDIQDHAIQEVHDSIGSHDLGCEKSRGMGWTWILCLVYLHRWLFYPLQTMLMASTKEDMVDKPDDPDCIFWKIDFMLAGLPRWMRPQMGSNDRTHLKIYNPENGSIISGSSTQKNLGRGGRRLSLAPDELAHVPEAEEIWNSTTRTCPNRLVGSTPNGQETFWRIMQSDIRKIRLHWSQHPEMARGLYIAKPTGEIEFLPSPEADTGNRRIYNRDGHLGVLCKPYEFPPDYDFIRDGKLRSPAYDHEDRRHSDPQWTAQEMDIDYLGSARQVFSGPMLDAYMARNCRPPLATGTFVYNRDTVEVERFDVDENGSWRVWIPAGDRAITINHEMRYVVAADISLGTGASNSTIAVYGRDGEKVAEFVDPFTSADNLARLAVAICKLFHHHHDPAFLIWEANGGPGRIFGDAVVKELNFGHVYMRTSEGDTKNTVSSKYGWWSNSDNKSAEIKNYERALREDEIVNRSSYAISDCRQFVYNGGKIVHMADSNATDPSGAAANHGDIVIADMLAAKVICDAKRVHASDDKPDPATIVGTPAWFAAQHELLTGSKHKRFWE